jgi:undecaprenyl-diphosphatase
MHTLDAVILGIVEGITEFLPVSSTGHLLVAERMLGIPQSEAADAYAIVIQLGAILAVLRIYGKRLSQLLAGLVGSSVEGRKLLICVIVAFLPAAVIGKLFDDTIESYLFGPIPIVIAWMVGGFVILWWSRRYGTRQQGHAVEALHWRAALAIGLFQCLALWPGTSRSLVTILGGVAVGLSLPASVEFSFMLGVLTLSAASVYSGLKHFHSLAHLGAMPLVVGMVASFASAYFAVKWMIDWINSQGLALFGYWRIAAAMLVGYLVVIDWM